MNYNFKYMIYTVCAVLLWNCSTTVASSMEFRSAKTSARSEKNLKKAEDWGLKALNMEIHSTDASVPYFLAIEIYKPQKRWNDMAAMLAEAIKRNPNQTLERQITLDDGTRLTTIKDGVDAYRSQLWVNLYNGALSLYENGDQEKAMEQFTLALTVDPTNVQTYIVLAKFNKENNDLKKSKELIDNAYSLTGLTVETKTELLLIKAEIYKAEGNMDEAMNYYELAYNENNSITSILAILEINLVNENYLKAIDWGERAMSNRAQLDRSYFGHLLYNIGLAYRGAGSIYYDNAADIINQINNGNEIQLVTKTEGINNLKLSKENFSRAREYFLDAEVEEMQDAGDRAKQMKNIIKEINNVYIPFFEKYNPVD
mgnify:CR=1 FL=1